MKVTLCTYTRDGAESELGPDLAATVQAALSHYSDKLRSGRPPLAPPRFIVSRREDSESEVLDLVVAPEVEAALEHEASRQDVDLEALAAHSVLVYLAELDFLSAERCV